jgi:spermidine synthase
MGAIIGSLMAVFILIPLIGVYKTIIAGSLANVSIGVLYLTVLTKSTGLRRRLFFAAVPVVLAVLGIVFLPTWNSAVLSSGPFLYANKYKRFARQRNVSIEKAITTGRHLLYYKDGLSATVSVRVDADGNLSMQINGKTDASTQADKQTQLFLAQLPILLHSDPESALVIGLGSGITLGSLEKYPLTSIDCLEISEAVVEASSFFNKSNRNALEDPRLQLHLTDARNWVTFTDRKYDIITSEPSNPWIAGIGSLFTEEFFELASQRLNKRGVMIQWIHAYSMSVSDFKTVIKTFSSVFPHTTVWEASLGKDYILVGSMEKMFADVQHISNRIRQGEIQEELIALGIIDIPTLFSRLVMDEASVSEFIEGAQINTDDNAHLEYSAPLNIYNYNENLDFLSLISRYRNSSTVRMARSTLTADITWESQLNRYIRAKDLSAQGFIKLFQGKDQEAFEILQNAYDLNPGDPGISGLLVPVYLKRGNEFLESGDNISAFKEYEKIAKINPENAVAYNNLGSILYEVGRYNEARVMFERAVSLNTYNGKAHFNLGETYLSLGQAQAAQDEFQYVLRLDPDNAHAHNSMGVTFERLENLPAAREEYEKAIALEPKYVKARVNLGNYFFLTEDYQSAIKYYLEVLDIDSNNYQAYYNLGAAYFKIKKWSEARDAWMRTLQINPNHKQAENGLSLLRSQSIEDSD